MKHLQTFILAWLLPTTAAAGPDAGIAVKGGLNAATFDEDYRINRYGFAGGLGGDLQWALGGPFSLAAQADLLYMPRGARTVMDGMELGRIRSHYFDVALAARPTVRLGPMEVYLLLGGSVNLLLKVNKASASSMEVDATDDFHRVDVAVLVGVGGALRLPERTYGPFHGGRIFLEGRHDHGLLDTDAVNGGFKNRSTSLMLGVSFALTSRTSPAPPPPNEPPTTAPAGVVNE